MQQRTFNPEHITKQDMKLIADHLEDFIVVHDEIMIIPEELREKESTIKDAKGMFKKLIKKLREGDVSVFKDMEDWNNVL